MSEKHVSEKAPKLSLDDLANREMDSASNALFDEFSKGARQLFRGALQLAERTDDSRASSSLPLWEKNLPRTIQGP